MIYEKESNTQTKYIKIRGDWKQVSEYIKSAEYRRMKIEEQIR